MPSVIITTPRQTSSGNFRTSSVYVSQPSPSLRIAWISGPTGPSGRQSVVTGIYPIYYDSGQQAVGIYSGYFALSGDLTDTGQYLYSLITGASGYLATKIDSSGFYLETKIGSLSGFVTAYYATMAYVNGASGALQYHIDELDSWTGAAPSIFVLKSESGQFASDTDISNLSGYIVGSYTTYAQFTGASGTLQSQINLMYPASNPSGFITGVNSGYLAPTGWVNQYYYPRSNPTGYITGFNSGDYATYVQLTGASGALQTQIGSIASWSGSSTGLYYPRYENPIGYITTGDADLRYFNINEALSGTGSFATTGWTDQNYYPRSNPSGYITGVATGHNHDSQYYPLANNPSGYVTGNVVRPGETGIFATYSQLTGASGALQGQIDSIDITRVISLNASTGNIILTGAGNISVTTLGQTTTISGLDISGLSQGQADALYYPLAQNPSGYLTSGTLTNIIGHTGITTEILSGYTNYFIEFGPTYAFAPSVTYSLEYSGDNFLAHKIGNIYTSGYDLDFSSEILTSGVLVHTTVYLNPSLQAMGIISGTVDLSSYATISYVDGASGLLQDQIDAITPADGVTTLNGLTGNLTITGVGGIVVQSSGAGTLTISGGAQVDLSGLITTGNADSRYYPSATNPSGYVTGSVVRPSETGRFYLASNPSGFITGVGQLSALQFAGVTSDPAGNGNMWYRSDLCEFRVQICDVVYKLPLTPV
jgi:hypothetical protein